jgi:hypothetical protein
MTMLAASLMHFIIKASNKSEKFSRKNQQECVAYVIFAVACCCGALLLTDEKFSALMTLSASFQCLGFALLLLQVLRGRGTKSVSTHTLLLYMIALSFRLSATVPYESYIPVDRSGDYLYQTIEATSLVLVVATLFKMLNLYSDDFTRENKLGIMSIIAICGGAAMYVHPNLNQVIVADRSWTFSVYLEALVMVPQLFMLTKLGGAVESLQGHYMACTFASRLTMLRLWSKSYVELSHTEEDKWAGVGVLGAHILACIVLADFMYLYVRSFRSGRAGIMPLQI